jgi:hypothetical protein
LTQLGEFQFSLQYREPWSLGRERGRERENGKGGQRRGGGEKGEEEGIVV